MGRHLEPKPQGGGKKFYYHSHLSDSDRCGRVVKLFFGPRFWRSALALIISLCQADGIVSPSNTGQTYLPLKQSQVSPFLMFGKCGPEQIQGSYLTVCVKPSGKVTRIWGARDFPGEDKEGRRSRPKGAKVRYCSAFRISGPPPPRQAAGDPCRGGFLFSQQKQISFWHTQLPKLS